uniref:zinc finger SWIM domain-containing protein 7 isoform X2 n=1 Tax=Jaculus jaculus TaxID=51337 RepID=UPI001E1B024C|nr:zinc finger SWIM domain-containing protein 7 isoform X2 [Jaculus jaculus]
MEAALPAVAEELLSEMAAAVRDGAPIPDEHLLSLKFVFGSSAIQALDLVDRQSVTLISSPSGRHVYQDLTALTRLPPSEIPTSPVLVSSSWKFWQNIHMFGLLSLLFMSCICLLSAKEE